MPVFVSEFGVDVGCPGSVALNEEVVSQADAVATVRNDYDGPETVTLSLDCSDGRFSGSNFDSRTIEPGESATLRTNSGCGGLYDTPERRTVTATATVVGETKSTTCTFTVA
jgi:hypothetical protein